VGFCAPLLCRSFPYLLGLNVCNIPKYKFFPVNQDAGMLPTNNLIRRFSK